MIIPVYYVVRGEVEGIWKAENVPCFRHGEDRLYGQACIQTPKIRGLRTLFENFRPSIFFRESLLMYPSFSTPQAFLHSAIRHSIVRSRCVMLCMERIHTLPHRFSTYHAQNLEMSIHSISQAQSLLFNMPHAFPGVVWFASMPKVHSLGPCNIIIKKIAECVQANVPSLLESGLPPPTHT